MGKKSFSNDHSSLALILKQSFIEIMCSLKDLILTDVKLAMKSGEKENLGALRLISAAFKQHEVDKRENVSDQIAVTILMRMSKQRRESITQFEAGNREDLARQEKLELNIIAKYLPIQLSETEIAQEVESAINKAKASAMKDMGKVMEILNQSLAGKADMAKISAFVKQKLLPQ